MTFTQALWYFILYAFLGWCLEVVYCSVCTGKFVNRGFLNGPFCPIYGFGALVLVLILSPIAQNGLLLLFFASALLCSLLELAGGWVLKKIFHTSWWDYSGQPFNLGGYICLKFCLLWGLAGVVAVRLIHPLMRDFVALFPPMLSVIFLVACYALLLVDLGVTVLALRRLNRELAEIDRLAAGLQQGSNALAKRLGNTAIAVAERLETLELDSKKKHITETFSEKSIKVTAALAPDALRDALKNAAEKHAPVLTRLIRAFPKMKSLRYADAFARLKAAMEKRLSHGQPHDDAFDEPESPSQ